MGQFCTYIWHDPKDGTPRYVGCGLRNKRPRSHLNASHNKQLEYMLKKRAREGYDLHPIIIDAPSQNSSLAMEIFWIAVHGRKDLGTGTLFNHTDGGEGGSGVIVPPELVAQRKASSAVTNATPASRAKRAMAACEVQNRPHVKRAKVQGNNKRWADPIAHETQSAKMKGRPKPKMLCSCGKLVDAGNKARWHKGCP